jgi:ferredoxin/flavodoxin---NADP+ reductase
VLEEIITKITHWSDRTFSFRCTRSSTFRFNSGEFAMIGLNINGKNCIRAYSIVSPPWADYIEFLSIKNVGQLTNELANINEGDSILLLPKCTGTLRNAFLSPGGKRLTLLSTGTGLAPFMSTIRDLEILETFDAINLVHSVRNKDDLAYFEELSTAFKDAEPDLYEIISEKLTYTSLVTGSGDQRIDARFIQPDDRVMACGNLQFNYDVIEWCTKLGMREGSNREQGEFVIEKAFVDANT